MLVEFVVGGPPISNQSPGPNLKAWRVKVSAEVTTRWAGKPPVVTPVRVTIINFHLADKPSVDVDNMSKPIHDEMNRLRYHDDRQIRQAEIVHERITSPMVIVGVSKMLVDAVQAGSEFIYVRVAEPLDPYPLPR